MTKAYLVLEDGQVFEGESFGAAVESIGELVFTTGVVGYVETWTDPCYRGQILLHTFPAMGNYGWIPEDMAAAGSHMQGVVVREWCEEPSNFRAGITLDAYLKQQNIPGICGVDTRELTRLVRDRGNLRAMITTKPPQGVPETLKAFRVESALAFAGRGEKRSLQSAGIPRCHAAVLDCGDGEALARELLERGCRVTVYPMSATAREILSDAPAGLCVSAGPGDPMDNAPVVEELRTLLGQLPMLGIGLGHQLMALAAGAKTKKLPYGHRGGNQPVRELSSGRVYITGQNHGYAVAKESLEAAGAALTYANINDGSCEGVAYPDKQAFSLQFHPAAHPGPREMEYGFDRFVSMMEGEKLCR